MKRLIFIVSFILANQFTYSQLRVVGLKFGAGYTIVNIEEAINKSDLEEWDHGGAIVKFHADYKLKENLFFSGELGFNRLYYWEYNYTDGFYTGTYWNSEWTTNFSGLLKKYFAPNLSFSGGVGIHIFNDGSGVVPGIVAGIEYDKELNEATYLPINIRIESIFGNSTPTSILIGTGLKFRR